MSKQAEGEARAGDPLDDDFLSRWSRRKRAARAETQTSSSGVESAAAPAAPAAIETPAPEPSAGELTDADMPPLETLDERSDYSGFFSPKVSAELRKAALRKLFHSPAFNVVDGLDDYDDDFTRFQALGDILTSDMRARLEREAEQRAEAETEPAGAVRSERAGAPSEDGPVAGSGEDAAEAELAAGEQQIVRTEDAGERQPRNVADPEAGEEDAR